MEDGPVKEGFVETIGSYMKLAYRTWNKEHYVSDDVIIDDLESLSKGKLMLEEDAKLDGLTQHHRRRKSSNDRRGGRDRDDYRGGRDRENRGRRGGRRDGGGRNSYRDRDDRGGGRGGYRRRR